MKVKRHQDRHRLCGLCCALVRETEFPGKEWVCAECRAAGRVWVIPLVKVGDTYARYDTRAVFEGWRVFRVAQGESRGQYETEVRSPLGEFYAAGGAAVAFCTKTTRAATMLVKKFPALRVLVSGDDGRTVLLMPVELFPVVAKHVRAYRSRKRETPLTEKQKGVLARARAARQAAVQQPTLL